MMAREGSSDVPAKKQKLDPGSLSPREEKSTSQPSRLDIVPVEILAEILYYATSPKDVLSVARCNKRLCATLLNPSNVMIWRRARSHCIVPGLPPPLPGWSESAYAAFIFDAGNCYVCGTFTQRMYFSFAIRIRLCGKHKCRKIFINEHITKRVLAFSDENKSSFFFQRLRQVDVPPTFGTVPPWPLSHPSYCLRTDLEKVLTEYEEMDAGGIPQDEYLRLRDADFQLHFRVFQHARLLSEWCQMWRSRYRAVKASNMAFARNLAMEAGWSLHDLLKNPTYLPLHRSHNLCLETTPESVVRSLMTKIDAEILSQMENRERRQKSHAQQIRRADIARHHDRLIEKMSHPVLPILAEFRGLPIIRALQDREDTAPFPSNSVHSSSARPAKTPRVLKSELKSSQLIGGMINSDIKQWVDTALRKFDALLGQPNWKRASTKLLHPSERANARFICTLCQSTPKGHTTPHSLNFRKACAHECPGHRTKAAAKRKWRADQFVPDQKAIDVLSQALALMKLTAENRETESEAISIGARFLCNSCDPPAIMDFWRLAEHCHRHDTMQVALISTVEANALTAGRQYDMGSFAFYTALADKTKRMKQTKTFGCRHCQFETIKPKRAHNSQNSGGLVERRFTFNGMVSHAKEKHGINPMGDEDFFRDNSVFADEMGSI